MSNKTMGEPSFVKDCLMQIAAGGSAGFIEICTMHPLDVVKTRLQVQTAGQVGNYTSVADCFKKIIKSEGYIFKKQFILNHLLKYRFYRFLAIYKGILPPILAETPKRATKFFTFEQYKNLFNVGFLKNTPYVSILFSRLTNI
jgi:solute carrier family 25 (mitochondrial 2-oxodicarboxylate transporter), member 21